MTCKISIFLKLYISQNGQPGGAAWGCDGPTYIVPHPPPILGQFWVQVWDDFEEDFGPILSTILGQFWDSFGMILRMILRTIT
jgi:hypothetical protein